MIRSLIRVILHLRLWIVERFRFGQLPIALFWAGLVGLIGALASILFRDAIQNVQWLLTHHSGSLVKTAMTLTWWQRLIVPTTGGLFAGLVLHFGIRFIKGQSSTDYMEAVALGQGIIRTRSTLVKSVSSLFTIASGGSIGREGPMVQLSAMLASLIGRYTKFSTPRLRLLVACGAAAGIASAYNAPIAGALFVAEIILGSIAMESFGPLVFSSVVATITVHQLLGAKPAYEIPVFHVFSNWEFLLYLVLGVFVGGLSPFFSQLLRAGETTFSCLRLPLYLKLALGGLCVGLVSILQPEVWGNGYSIVGSILRDNWFWQVLLVVLIVKLVATVATVGSGAVGGIFTPILFVGAVLGCLFGKVVHTIGPHMTAAPGAYALVGMGCFLSATTQAPLMAIIMLFEMTLQYDVVLPLMLACVTAYFMAKSLGQNSIYAAHLSQKKKENPTPSWENMVVKDLLKENPVCISPTTSFGEIAKIFAQNRINYLYVINEQRRFLGVISLHDMKPYLNNEVLAESVLTLDFMKEEFPVLTPNMPLVAAFQVATTHGGERIPVISDLENRYLIGSVSKSDLLLSFSQKKGAVSSGLSGAIK